MLDYITLKSNMSSIQKEYYNTLYSNRQDILLTIYNLIKAGKKDLPDFDFNDFFTFYQTPLIKSNALDRWDSEVVRFLYHDADFIRFVDDYKSKKSAVDDGVIKCYLSGIFNKNKHGFSKLDSLCNQYLRYLNNQIREVSLDENLDQSFEEKHEDFNKYFVTYDKPFYEEEEYKENELKTLKIKFKKMYCKRNIDFLCFKVLSKVLLEGSIFKYADLEKKVISMSSEKYSAMQIFRILKKIHKQFLEFILNDEDANNYFSNDSIITFENKTYTFKDAIKYALLNFNIIKKIKMPNVSFKKEDQISNNDIKRQIINFCKDNEIPYSDKFGFYQQALIKLKLSNKLKSKRWATYIYSGGGFRDFKTGTTGYYTEILKLHLL